MTGSTDDGVDVVDTRSVSEVYAGPRQVTNRGLDFHRSTEKIGQKQVGDRCSVGVPCQGGA